MLQVSHFGKMLLLFSDSLVGIRNWLLVVDNLLQETVVEVVVDNLQLLLVVPVAAGNLRPSVAAVRNFPVVAVVGCSLNSLAVVVVVGSQWNVEISWTIYGDRSRRPVRRSR
jgi:hypothetical protein